MRSYLAVTGLLFSLFALMHLFITWRHAHVPGAESWVWPALIGVGSAALAAWAFRLLRSAPPSRS